MSQIIEKGYFFFEISDTQVLDLGDMSMKEWRDIKNRAKRIMDDKQTEHPQVAFVAAFLTLMMEKQQLAKPFNINA